MVTKKKIILVHGLWNSPKVFNKFKDSLIRKNFEVLIPNLPHDSGRTSIKVLSKNFNDYIKQNLEDDDEIDLLGFSMGGLISRIWLQDMDGWRRTKNFLSIGSPHIGTLTAQFIPEKYFCGISEMKLGSKLTRELNINSQYLKRINCLSFFCFLDLMVFPGWKAVLPCGKSISVPVWTHKSLIKNQSSIEIIISNLLANY